RRRMSNHPPLTQLITPKVEPVTDTIPQRCDYPSEIKSANAFGAEGVFGYLPRSCLCPSSLSRWSRLFSKLNPTLDQLRRRTNHPSRQPSYRTSYPGTPQICARL